MVEKKYFSKKLKLFREWPGFLLPFLWEHLLKYVPSTIIAWSLKSFWEQEVRWSFTRARSGPLPGYPRSFSLASLWADVGHWNLATWSYPKAQLTQCSNLAFAGKWLSLPIPLSIHGTSTRCHLPLLCSKSPGLAGQSLTLSLPFYPSLLFPLPLVHGCLKPGWL